MATFQPELFSSFTKIFSYTRVPSLFNLHSDPSFQIRVSQLFSALHTILEKPFFGDYGSYFTDSGLKGRYSHNVFLVWVNFGLVGFIVYCSILGLILKLILTIKLNKDNKLQIYVTGALGSVVAHIFSILT